MRFITLIGGLALLAACSSHGSTAAPTAATTTTTTPSSTPTTASAEGYVDAVNQLCEQLRPKILAVTDNGDPSKFTVKEYEAEVPAHTALEKQFDRAVAAIPVPPAAESAHQAFQAYVTFADGLDAKRLAAAHKGQAAFEAEVAAEDAAYPMSAVKQARDAAGFDASCDAR